MGKVLNLMDRLANALSGRGTSVDRRTRNAWLMEILDPAQVEAAYRTSWLVKKIVDVPAKDMTRQWRAWQAGKDKIEALEAEEARLGLQSKCQRALILARLFGGGALILSTGDGDTMAELNPETIRKGGLRFIHVMNRWELNLGQPTMDPESPWFRQPEYFEIATHGAYQNVKLHPSRVIPFIGQPAPEGGRFSQSDSWYWGDPIMLSIKDAVEDAATATAGFAALIDEAKLDIIKIPDLMQVWATAEHEERLQTRMAIANSAKSTHRALILDGNEDWNQRQVTWAGIPDVIMTFLEVVAGAADIPVTRLLGQSPKGLQSTGKGEQGDYHDKVEADQHELLRPQLERIDELLIRSALGSRPGDIYFEFNPLDEPDEKEDAEIEAKAASTLKTYADIGLFDDEALATIAKNRMIESGRWPGCEAAFEANPDVPEDEGDPDELLTAEERAAAKAEELRSKGAVSDTQAVALITDARPRSLYVQRKLLNADELLAWAKGQGFTDTLDAGELHVTVLYSRTPVDWLKMGEAWDSDGDGKMTVPAGGARIVEPLGDKGAIVLLFNSSSLAWRHEQLVREGASHDFADYQPHVTITYAKPDGLNLDEVEPYRGRLVFGPEIFEEVNEDWAPAMGKGVGKGATSPFADSGHWEHQPRDPGGEGGGQWVAGGGGADEGRAEQLTREAKAQLIAANQGKSIDEIRAEATANQAALHQLGEAVETELGINFEPPPPGYEVKTRESLERKIRDEGYSGPHEITDVSRASFVVTSPEQAEQVIGRLARRGTVYDKGWKRLEQTGYLDRKLYLQHPNGGVSEIQIVPAGVHQLKFGQGHVLYEIIRRPDRPLEARKAAARKSRTIYAKAIRAEGFEVVAK